MSFSSIEERLAGKFDRANAAKTRQLDALFWILAICEAPNATFAEDPTDDPFDIEIATPYRRLEMIRQILRRRGIVAEKLRGKI